MKIRLLETVLIQRTPTAAGTVVEVSASDAASLIRRRMAEPEGDVETEATFLSTDDGPSDETRPAPTRRNNAKLK